MGHIQDRWTVPGPNGKRVKSPRHGVGKRWLVRWEEGGARKSRSFATKDAAELHLSKIVVDQSQGTHVLSTNTTLAEYGDQWVKAQIHQRPSSAEQMEIRWRVHIRPALGQVKVSELTRQRVQAAVIEWSETLAPSTVGVTYGYLASIMKSATHDRLVRESPCRGVNLPRDEHERVVPLTVLQVHRIAEAVAPRYRAMVLLGAATGMRSGELRGLTVDRLLFAGGLLRIRIDRQLRTTAPTWGPPKTEKSDRAVTVGERTAEMIRRHMMEFPPHESGLIFTGREHGPLARTSAASAWNAATEGMGLRARAGWHELRHHHASLLIAAGLSVTAVADRLGHQDSTETLRTYAHLWEDDEERARGVVEASLWSAVPAVNDGVEHPESIQTLRIVR